jgi:hypothetical protein
MLKLLIMTAIIAACIAPAQAKPGVVCDRAGCQTVNVEPGCYIRHMGHVSFKVCGKPEEYGSRQ